MRQSPNYAQACGTHTRNRRITDWTTCENCPADRKGACSGVCSEMERYLGANANTTTHNSPTPNQAQETVEEITSGPIDVDAGIRRKRRMSEILRDNPSLVVIETPESLLLEEESEPDSLTEVLLHIDGYCKTAAKGNQRKRVILETAIIMYFLENYSTAQIAEVLGCQFEEFRGYKECTRKTGAKAGYGFRAPKGAYKVWRIVQRFQKTPLSPCFKKSHR